MRPIWTTLLFANLMFMSGCLVSDTGQERSCGEADPCLEEGGARATKSELNVVLDDCRGWQLMIETPRGSMADYFPPGFKEHGPIDAVTHVNLNQFSCAQIIVGNVSYADAAWFDMNAWARPENGDEDAPRRALLEVWTDVEAIAPSLSAAGVAARSGAVAEAGQPVSSGFSVATWTWTLEQGMAEFIIPTDTRSMVERTYDLEAAYGESGQSRIRWEGGGLGHDAFAGRCFCSTQGGAAIHAEGDHPISRAVWAGDHIAAEVGVVRAGYTMAVVLTPDLMELNL